MKEKIKNLINELKNGDMKELGRIIKFCLVGGANTVVDFVFKGITQIWVGVAASQVIGYTAGVINSYLLNRYFTFKDKKTNNVIKEIIPFLVINLISLGVSVAMDVWLENGLGLYWLYAKLIILPVTLCINFIGSKFFVWKDKKDGD